MGTGRRSALAWLTGCYLAVVALITLSPQPDQSGGGVLAGLAHLLAGHAATAWLTVDRLEFTANVIMFCPFGLLFCLLLGRRRWWLVLLLAIGATLAIEAAQLLIPNRVSDPRDLVANTGGAAIGLLAGLLIRR